jgi:hypothetical protein
VTLDDFIPSDDGVDEQAIRELIKRRRLQMLVHSAIYYDLDENVITDHQWQQWAEELAHLQNTYPKLAVLGEGAYPGCWDWEFRDWKGETGAHLPHRHPWVRAKALYVLELGKNAATRHLRT